MGTDWMSGEKRDPKNRILDEMTVDHTNAIERDFDLAKRLVRITQGGNVEVLHESQLNTKERIQLYLIGKLYAKEAGLSDTEMVSNEELMNELGLVAGSLHGRLTDLRDAGLILRIKGQGPVVHTVPLNLVGRTLKEIGGKLGELDQGD